MKTGQRFTAKNKLGVTSNFTYINKLKGIWHLIYSEESTNEFEVEDEWFNQRKIEETK